MKKFNRSVNPQSIEADAKVCQLVSCPACRNCSCGPEAGILGYGVISNGDISAGMKGYLSSSMTENN